MNTDTPAELPTVVLTNPIHADAAALLGRHARIVQPADGRPDTLRAAVRDAHGLIVRTHLPDDIFDHAPNLRGVVRHGVGLDMIPMEAAVRHRIPVANVPGANTSAVVEYCLAAMLTLRRGLPRMDAALRASGWQAARALADDADELDGATCGIVGVGAIGSRLAQAAMALGMNVLGLTRRPDRLPAGVRPADRETLFAGSDVIVLCCPLNDATRGLVDARAIAAMRPGAVLVNAARGPVVQSAPLLEALRARRISAALDVHDIQPLPADSDILSCPNVLLTPHAAGITAPSMRRMSLGAVEAMSCLLRGERPRHLVTPDFPA